MVTPDKNYAEHAGLVYFPRSNADLTSTTSCPACFTRLTSTTCTNCGLDVTHPAAAELHDTALAAAAALDHRVELIGRMRSEPAAAPAAATPEPAVALAHATAPAATVAAPAIPVPPPAARQPASAPATGTPAPAATADTAPRRHFGVQVILLIVGVSLLAVGAIFFLVYAFITFGLVWRSVIIGAVTVAAFVGASLLRRRRLGATAEAIAALAVVFVYLDAFAIRANNLFAAGDADGLVYWGATLLLTAAGFGLWHRLSGLRVPSVVAFTAAGPGLALLVAGLGQSLPDSTTAFAAFIALAAAGLVHVLAGSKAPERWISQGLGIVGLAAAAITALFLEPDSDWAPAIGLGIVAVVALLHVVVVARVGAGRPLGLAAGGLGAVAASVAAFVVEARVNDFALIVLVPPLVALVIALLLEFAARRLAGFPRSAARGAAWSAAAVFELALLFPLATAAAHAAAVLAQGGHRWSIRGGDSLGSDDVTRNAVIALLATVVIAAIAWQLGGRLTARRPVIAWAGFAAVILAAPLLGQHWLIVLAWLLAGAAAIVALAVAARRGSRTTVRVPLVVGGIIATAFAYSASWASIDTWWYGSVGTVALLVAARLATRATAARGILLGAAAILAFVAIGAEGWHGNERFQGGQGVALESTHFVLALAIVLVAAAALLARVLSAFEIRVLFWLSFGTAIGAAAASWVLGAGGVGIRFLVLPEFGTSVVLGAALVAALLVWVLPARLPAFGVERAAASIVVAPVAAWLADSLVRLAPFAPFVQAIAPVVAALLVAAIALATALLRPLGAPRWPLDLGVAAVSAVAVLLALLAPGPDRATWLVLLLAAVAALLLAVSKDGLFASSSPRRQVGWVAVALAVGALWWQLGDNRVRDLEPYVLPLAGALLIIALLVWRAARPQPSAAAPGIALAAFAVGLLPLAVVSTAGPVLRPILVAAVAAVLLLAGSLVRAERLRPYLDAAALVGALALVITAGGRATALAASRTTTDPALDAWLGGLFIVLAVAATAQARRRPIAAQVLLGIGFAALLIELFVLDGQFGTARAAVLIVLFCAVHVVGVLVDRSPATAAVGWMGFGLAALVAVVAVGRGAIDPLEWATAALSAALLTVGAIRLRRAAGASSWAWVAPGLLVLVLPSLFATFLDQPLLRLVGLGVACLLAIVIGAVAKLQAPLVIGSVVVLVHAIRTFAPQLVAVYQLTEWWVWAVIGGAVILFLGLTFEKRVRDLKAAATRVAALR